MEVKKIILIVVGCISLALGTAGIFLPVFPTVPFYVLTVYCFSKGSDRLHNWFIQTILYRKYIGNYLTKDGMPPLIKAGIVVGVSLFMGTFIFFMAKYEQWVAVAILALVWIFHMIYFLFFVKTKRKVNKGPQM